MKKFILILSILLSGFVYSQDSLSGKKYSSVLGMGDVLQLEGKSIKFLEIISDSRCPTGVSCIWEGEAKLLFGLYESGELLEEKVITASAGASLTSLVDLFPTADFLISGLKLYPYPSIGEKIAPSEYKVNVEVQERKEK